VSKYGLPIWKYVLNAALELGNVIFSPKEIIEKVHEKNPLIPENSIRTYVIAMAPNHPSSPHYPTTHKKHRYFYYLGKGKFRLLKEKPDLPSSRARNYKNNIESKDIQIISHVDKIQPGLTHITPNGKIAFLKKYKSTILNWVKTKEELIKSSRDSYSWNDKTTLDCVKNRNEISRKIILSRIKNSGGIDLDTLDQVIKWGFRRKFPLRDPKASLEITHKAFDYLDEGDIKEATKILLKIKYVGISRASKILGLFDQENLCIYDSRVGSALKDLKYGNEKIILCPPGYGRDYDAVSKPEIWAEYYEKLIWTLEIIRDYLNERGYTYRLADVEMALYMMGNA